MSGSLSRTFDNNFRVTGLSVDGQSPVSFTYDADGLLTGAGSLTLTRDPQTGLLTGSTLGSVTDSRTYTSYGELATDSAAYPAGLSFQAQYTRDAAGRIIQKVETINGTATTYGYSYDQDGRLTDVTVNGSAYGHYGYDSNGNRTSYTGPDGTTISGTYDNQDRMLTYGSFSYTYTANGELTSKTDTSTGQVTTYQYDVLGNLRGVTLPDGTAISYLIDGRNRRVGKEVNGTLTQAWLYDGQLRPVAELDGSGNVVSTFVYATHVNVPDAMVKGGVTYRIITDQLGSPRFIIDQATGNIAERLDYDAFGNVLLDTNPGFQPFGFAGGLYDSQTGLVRFGARDYDPQAGRWTSKDPILFAGRLSNLYEYPLGDPQNHLDPSGKQWTFVLAGLAVGYMVFEFFFDSPDQPPPPELRPLPGCGRSGCHTSDNPNLEGFLGPTPLGYVAPHGLGSPYDQFPFYVYYPNVYQRPNFGNGIPAHTHTDETTPPPDTDAPCFAP